MGVIGGYVHLHHIIKQVHHIFGPKHTSLHSRLKLPAILRACLQAPDT